MKTRLGLRRLRWSRARVRRLVLEQLTERIALAFGPGGDPPEDQGPPLECTLRAAIDQANFNAGKQLVGFYFGSDPLQNTSDTIFVVNSKYDYGDSDPLDGFCWTGNLQQSSPAFIQLKLGPLSITDPVVVQGSPSNFMPTTEVNGGNKIENGFVILGLGSSGSEINNLAITNFSKNGILIADSQANSLSGNFIGVDPSGSSPKPNGNNGVRIEGSYSVDNTVGGRQSNLISGNGKEGIYIGKGSYNNSFASNYIGTDRWGEKAIPNGSHGVLIDSTAGPNGGVGGLSTEKCERTVNKPHMCGSVISGNNGNGVMIEGTFPSRSIVSGVQVGTNLAGTRGLPNTQNGVLVRDASLVSISGSLISGNTLNGVVLDNAKYATVSGNQIGPGALGLRALTSGANVQQEGILLQNGSSAAIIADNTISGNKKNGIYLTGSTTDAAHISTNQIGLSREGTDIIANQGNGILADNGSDGHAIGFDRYSLSSGGRNFISGNGKNGIEISGGTGTRIQGNMIGMSLAANGRGPNTLHGVFITNGASDMIIGVDEVTPQGENMIVPKEKNYIAGNVKSGVYIDASSTKIRVTGNYIGVDTDSSGTVGFGNGEDGVTNLGSENQIGTDGDGLMDSSEGNTIKFNIRNGVSFQIGSQKGLIAGNRISRNGSNGVSIEDSSSNTIGNDGVSNNFIWSNKNAGILIKGTGSIGNTIHGNKIGHSGNNAKPTVPQQFGITLELASSNRIGKPSNTFYSTSNDIVFNELVGINLQFSDSNFIQANEISNNGGTNSGSGVRLIGSSRNYIGQGAKNGFNEIFSNFEDGVTLDVRSLDNNVIGNFIGRQWLGMAPLPNKVGVRIAFSSGNTIDRNFIEFNREDGVRIEAVSSSNTVKNNSIYKNERGGVWITGKSTENTLTRNNIVANGSWSRVEAGFGVRIDFNSSKNKIGLPSDPWNEAVPTYEAGNTIASNLGNGVLIENSDLNTIVANTIGGKIPYPDIDSSHGGNRRNGILIINGNKNQIGAPLDDVDHENVVFKANKHTNTIAGNGDDGVKVDSGKGNTIRLNSFFENGRLGINLRGNKDLPNGVTLNDILRGPSGVPDDDGQSSSEGNELQNFPFVGTEVEKENGERWLNVTFYSKPQTKYVFDFYSVQGKDQAGNWYGKNDPSGFGEGRTIFKTHTANTDESGYAAFKLFIGAIDPSRESGGYEEIYTITSTATDPDGNTSEFSGKEYKIFYGIDGTSTADWQPHADYMAPPQNTTRRLLHVLNLKRELENTVLFSGWSNGPSDFAWGSDSDDIHNKALGYIKQRYYYLKSQGITPSISVAGWSRGGAIALWVANDLSRQGIDVDYAGLYDPVDMAWVIPDDERLVQPKVKRVIAVGPKYDVFSEGTYKYEGQMDWRYFRRMSHHPLKEVVDDIFPVTYVNFNHGIARAPGNSKSEIELKLIDASHGAIGGCPGYNQGNKGTWSNFFGFSNYGEDENPHYHYPTDKSNSILADRLVRNGLRELGWPVLDLPDVVYGFSEENPSPNSKWRDQGDILPGVVYPSSNNGSGDRGEGESSSPFSAPAVTNQPGQLNGVLISPSNQTIVAPNERSSGLPLDATRSGRNAVALPPQVVPGVPSPPVTASALATRGDFAVAAPLRPIESTVLELAQWVHFPPNTSPWAANERWTDLLEDSPDRTFIAQDSHATPSIGAETVASPAEDLLVRRDRAWSDAEFVRQATLFVPLKDDEHDSASSPVLDWNKSRRNLPKGRQGTRL